MDEDATLIEKFKLLENEGRWDEILHRIDGLDTQGQIDASISFFRAWALFNVGRLSEALIYVGAGLLVDPASEWGQRLRFDLLIADGQIDDALMQYKSFILTHDNLENEKAYFVEQATNLSRIRDAYEVNKTRKVILGTLGQSNFALALQCFVKSDTLEMVLQTLLSLDGSENVSLVILQDGINGNPKKHEWESEHSKVREVIAGKIPRLLSRFKNVEVFCEKDNYGTAPTCKRLLDYVANNYEAFLFIEDDCLLSPDSINWAKYCIDKLISIYEHWFFTCESMFFDNISSQFIEPKSLMQIEGFAKHKFIQKSYVDVDFVPSTCFGTKSCIWRNCSDVRGFTRGPESLTKFMQSLGRLTIAPVVPRASDIGMKHPLGYSRTLNGLENVAETKATYVLAPASDAPIRYCSYSGDKVLLFRATSDLEKNSIFELAAWLKSME